MYAFKKRYIYVYTNDIQVARGYNKVKRSVISCFVFPTDVALYAYRSDHSFSINGRSPLRAAAVPAVAVVVVVVRPMQTRY